MNTVNTNGPRGTIIKVPDATPGLLLLMGRQYAFTLEGVWRSAVAPAPNQSVTVELDNTGTVVAISVIDQGQIAKEKLAEFGGVAQERGKVVAGQIQTGIGALAARMGAVTLSVAVLIWIVWFFIPAAGVGGGGEDVASYTFWKLIGTNFADQMSMMGGGHARGWLRLIGFAAIVAPFAAPFIRAGWSRYLNAAPLAVVLLGWLVIHQNMAGTFGQMGADNPFSYRWGFYLLLAACLALAANALKKGPVYETRGSVA
jgi:hypothetical protein